MDSSASHTVFMGGTNTKASPLGLFQHKDMNRLGNDRKEYSQCQCPVVLGNRFSAVGALILLAWLGPVTTIPFSQCPLWREEWARGEGMRPGVLGW